MRIIILGFMLALNYCFVFAQEIGFEYTSPQNLTVCGDDSLNLKFTNNTSAEIKNVTFKLRFPLGVNYLNGSIVNALELNIGNLNFPEFIILSVPAKGTVNIRLSISANCEAFENANKAQKFENYFWISYLQKVDSLKSTPPYSILTPFLILDQIQDVLIPLSTRQKRKLKITNTRLGACKNFILMDNHGSSKISSTYGKTLIQNDTMLVLMFSGGDFTKIGDKDSLFERDEIIEIDEDIEAIGCTPYQIASEVSVKWGCDSLYCQDSKESSIVIFEKSNFRANLNFTPIVKTPSCICSKDGANQELIIKNIGDGIADSICIKLRVQPIGLPDPIGLRDNSIEVSNKQAVYTLQYFDRIPMCLSTSGDSVYTSAEVCFKELNVDDELKIVFNWISCLTTIDSTKQLSWFYSYNYKTRCIENSERVGDLIEVKMQKIIQPEVRLTSKLKDNITSVENKKVYVLQNSIFFSQLLSNEIFKLSIVLPCPLSILDTMFLLDGKLPLEKFLTRSNDGTSLLTLSYKAPFSSAQLLQEIPLYSNCDDSCALSFPSGSKTKFITSCPTPRIKAQTLSGLICLKASLSCKDNEGSCGNNTTTQFDVNINCDSISKRIDSIPGYLKFDVFGQRISYGNKDDNNDRFFETGILDTSKIIKTNFITGDSLQFDFRSVICSDDTMRTYDSVAFVISHQVTFANLFSDIKYYDARNKKYYTIPFLNIKKFIQKAPGLNCGETGLSGSGFGSGNSLELNIEQFHMLVPELPADHRFANGDSFNIKITGKVVSTVNDRLVNLDFNYYAFLFDKKNNFLLPFQCGNSTQKFKQVTNNKRIEFRQSEAFICKRNFTLPSVFVYGSKNLHNFFPNEFRSLNKISDLRYLTSTPIRLDSIKFNISYTTNGVPKVIDTKVFVPKLDQNNWVVDSLDLLSLRYDESYILEMIAFGSIQNCRAVVGVNDLSAILSMRLDKDFDAGFHLDPNFVDILSDYQFSKYFAVKNYFGNEAIHVINKSIVSSSKILQWSASVNSVKFPGYFLVQFSSSKGLIDSFEIKNSGSPSKFVSLDSSRFLIGPIEPNQDYIFNFCAKNNSCEADTILINSIWSCGKDFSFMDSCSTSQFNIPVSSEPPQLELIVNQNSKEVQLCDTLPELNIELYNGGEGYAYHPQLLIDIPSGVRLIPTTLFYAYPSNSAYVPLPMPTFLSGNTYFWNFEDFVQAIQANGLPGYNSFPKNSILLKLKAITDCNSTVNGYFSFKLQGENNCGIMSNSIRKAGSLIKIKGITQSANSSLQITVDSTSICQDELVFHVNWKTNADISFNDTFRILLPGGIEFVQGSITSINHYIFSNPMQRTINGNRYLLVSVPTGVPSNEFLGFSFRLKNFNLLGCHEYRIPVDLTSSVSTFCSSIKGQCNAFVIKGEATVNFSKVGTTVKLLEFNLFKKEKQQYYRLKMSIQNLKNHLDSSICISLYQDEKNIQIIDVKDIRVAMLKIPYDSFDMDGNFEFTFPLDSFLLDQCRYITVLENKCLCNADTIFWKKQETDSIEIEKKVCKQTTLTIGVDKRDGHYYSWNIPCSNCPMITIENKYSATHDTIVQYFLRDSTEDGCQSIYVYHVKFLSDNLGLKKCQLICKEDSVVLHAGQRLIYVWRGNFENPKDSIQKISKVITDTSYLLDYIDGNGCSGTDTFCIQVSDNLNHLTITADTTIHLQDEVILEVTKGFQYKWIPEKYLDCYNCYLVHARPDSNITYIVEVTDSLGCTRFLKVSIKILFPQCDSSTFFIPNAFSPNKDNVNDVFYVRANNVERIFLIVYDRWGEKVFESRDLNLGWDGTFKGTNLPPDVYAYYCELYCIGGKKIVHKGNVSLLK